MFMKDLILEKLGFNLNNLENCNPADTYFYSLIFEKIGSKIDIRTITKELSDEELLSISESMIGINQEADKERSIIVARNYVELLVKQITEEKLKNLENKYPDTDMQ